MIFSVNKKSLSFPGRMTTTVSNKVFYNNIFKRSMYRSNHLAAKTSFNFLEKILNPEILNKISKEDHNSFLKILFDYSFDPNNGTLQHKASLLHMIFRQKYSSNIFNEHYLQRYPESKVDFVKNILVDFRIFSELPVVRKYEETFSKDIKQILLTNDSIKTTFEKQLQPNPDMLVTLMNNKSIYQDIKSGMNITKHFTRGSMSLLTFDINKQIIPFTSEDLDLYRFNKERLESISMALLHDNITDNIFRKTLGESFNILNTENDIFKMHPRIQDLLWNNMQCNPIYRRSVAFTFVEHQDILVSNNKYDVYKNKFISLLSDRKYDPNKIGDRKEIFRAMLRAYREVDNDLTKKIMHMVNETGITIDNDFLTIFAKLIKETLV
jgi:hypothetical protein